MVEEALFVTSWNCVYMYAFVIMCIADRQGGHWNQRPASNHQPRSVRDTHIFALTNKIMPQQKRVAQTATVVGMAAVSHKSRLVNAGLLDAANQLDPQSRFRLWLKSVMHSQQTSQPTPSRPTPPAPLRLAPPPPRTGRSSTSQLLLPLLP